MELYNKRLTGFDLLNEKLRFRESSAQTLLLAAKLESLARENCLWRVKSR
jgi:hypothetical protein